MGVDPGDNPDIQVSDSEGSVDQRMSFLAHRVNANFTRVANRMLQHLDINIIESRILLFLLEAKHIKVGELARALALPQSTISQQLTRLKSRRLIHRRRTREDARSVAITLTTSGQEAAEACEKFSLYVQHRLTQEIGQPELDDLGQKLNRVLEALSTPDLFPDEQDSAVQSAVRKKVRG